MYIIASIIAMVAMYTVSFHCFSSFALFHYPNDTIYQYFFLNINVFMALYFPFNFCITCFESML
ncbi:hypothetical protein BDF19DRAFT_451397 [Syncephalis fuscata]|nr:hypothetical protein BDF19DRAFT_451397 [Syncephalis fuscata]